MRPGMPNPYVWEANSRLMQHHQPCAGPPPGRWGLSGGDTDILMVWLNRVLSPHLLPWLSPSPHDSPTSMAHPPSPHDSPTSMAQSQPWQTPSLSSWMNLYSTPNVGTGRGTAVIQMSPGVHW